MPSSMSRVFRSLNNQVQRTKRHLPMINSIASTYSQYLLSSSQIQRKKALMAWFKGIPELTGLGSKVAKDIVYDHHFEPVNPNESGRNKVLKANKFAQEMELSSVMFSQALDAIITGEGYGWKGHIPEKEVKEAIAKCVKRKFGVETKESVDWAYRELKATEGFADVDGIDEDILKPRKYRYLPSSTMEIMFNQYDIEKYSHVVGTHQEIFMPKEVIRFTFMEADGRINGFTPVESILVQLELLRQMWMNHLSLHKNGGIPDKIITLENTREGSPAYKRIEEQLAKYKLVENKHGSMLFTGKVSIEDLQQLDKMQFMDSGLYITGLIAMQWEIPRSSIPYIVGGTNTKDDTGGNSEKGYWRNIEFFQRAYAETMNTQLWIPHFGVKIVFDNVFIQQDVQKQTAKQLMLNNIKVENELLRTNDKQLSPLKIMRLLGYDETDLVEAKEEIMPPMGNGMNNQLSDSDKFDTQGKKNIKANKRSEQANVIQSRGAAPTGVGKG